MPSLLEYVGMPYQEEEVIDQVPTRSEPADPSWIDPAEAERLFADAVENSETPEEVKEVIHEIFEEHPYMHEELGEVLGKDYYKGAIDNFIKVFNDKFPGIVRYEG